MSDSKSRNGKGAGGNGKVSMSPFERWAHFVSNILVGGTGIVYAIMRYALEPEQAWDVVNHPLQPHVQHLHVWTAPLLVFAIGLNWSRHIWPRRFRRDLPRYWSGLLLAASVVPMVFSGYLIQTAVAQTWRQVWVIVHVAASALWLSGFVTHAVLLGVYAIRTGTNPLRVSREPVPSARPRSVP